MVWVYYNQASLANYQGLFHIKDASVNFFEGGITPSATNVHVDLLAGAYTSSTSMPLATFRNTWHFLGYYLEG